MAADAVDSDNLYALHARTLWNAFVQEGPSFWLLCTYLMFEYVRPQSLYPAIDVFPWSPAVMGATALAWLMSRRRPAVATPANGFLLLFTFVVVLSSIAAYRPNESFSHLYIYLLWLVAYFLITKIVVTERRLLLLILAFVLFNLKMTQFAMRSWASIGFAFRAQGTGGAPGWFENSGEFGIEMCIFLPIVTYLALALRPYLARWKFMALLGAAGTALVGIVASSSRGAELGVAAVMIFMLARSRYKARAFVAAVVIGALFYFAIPPESKERMRVAGTDYTSQTRLTFWTHAIEMADAHPLLGIGYWNWDTYYPEHYNGEKHLTHNSLLQAASELGYSGLIALLLLIGCTFVLNARSRSLAIRAGPHGRVAYHLAVGVDGAMVGFLVSGFFISALYYPFVWINLSMTVALNTVAMSLPSFAPERLRSRAGQRLGAVTLKEVPAKTPEWQSAVPRQ